MKRSELVEKLSNTNVPLTAEQAEKVVTVFLDEISTALASGKRVELRGFGIFSVRKRLQRTGRNPRTGGIVNVSSKNVPFFKTGKQLRDRLNAE